MKAMTMLVRGFIVRGFSGGSVVENLPGNAEDLSSIPDPGRSHMPPSN